MRDSATQPLVYQISAVADELRILKDILRSQINVVSSVAERVVQQIGKPSLFEGDRERAADAVDPPSTPTTSRSPDATDERKARILKALQRVVRRRHEQLTNSIERLEETSERLQAQV